MLYCNTCQSDVREEDVIKVTQGLHLRANCPKCGKYIKFLKQNKASRVSRNEKMPFGKYAGKSIAEITADDPGYARWAAETLDGRYGRLFSDSYHKYMNAPKPAKRAAVYDKDEDMLIVQI